MATFFDAAGQYFQNRLDRATMPFTNPSGYFDQRMDRRFGDLYETEEERRRREEAERQQRLVSGPVAPAQAPTPGLTESEVAPGYQYQPTKPQPVKQTITIDPITGQQKMKLEGSVQDLSAANALTPTVSMPSTPMAPGGMTGPTPEEIMRDEEQRRQYEMMMARPTGPVAPPQASVQMAAAPTTTMTDVTAPTTGTIATAPAAPAQAISPEQLQRQMMQQDIQEGPVVRQAVAEGAGPASMQWFNIITAAQNDPNAMERIARDPNTPEQWRRVAASQASITLEDRRKMEQAEARAQKIIADGGRDLAREIRKPSEEGSYLKAYLFGRLRMNDLARAEQAKLSSSWQQASDAQGNRALIRFRGDGLPLEGIGSDNRPIGQDQLMQFAGATKGTEVGANVYGDPTGKFPGTFVLERRPGQNVYREIGTNRVASAEESQAMRYLGAQGTLGDQRARLLQELNLKLQGRTAEEQLAITRNYNSLLVGNGYAPVQPGEVPLTAPQIADAAKPPAGQAQPPAGQAPGAKPSRPTQTTLESGTAGATTAATERSKSVDAFSVKQSDVASAAGDTATVARRVRTSIDQNPQITQLLTRTDDKGRNLVTAMVASIDAGLGGSEAIETAMKQLKFNVNDQAVFEQVKGDLITLGLAIARENKGQGTFTDFERRLLQQSVGDIARNQPRAIQYRMEIFEYAAEKAQRKSEFIEDFRARNPNATVGQINNAWRKESKTQDEAFEKRMQDTYIRPKKKQGYSVEPMPSTGAG